MWRKRAFFCCLSFWLLPSLARKSWIKYQEQHNPISRLRSMGALLICAQPRTSVILLLERAKLDAWLLTLLRDSLYDDAD